MRSCIIIPARINSTRLARKMLLNRTGMPLICHTAQVASRSHHANDVIVATDSQEIIDVCTEYGYKSVLTNGTISCGSERVAIAAKEEYDIVVNWQGDEPETDPVIVDKMIEMVEADESLFIATFAHRTKNRREIEDKSNVKVIVDGDDNALYFSRLPIPFSDNNFTEHLIHHGIYVYNLDALASVLSLTSPAIEVAEHLEQLRFLYYGYKIRVITVDSGYGGIDTEDDYSAFVERYHSSSQTKI